MNWMSKKVGIAIDEKKRKNMCHTVKNNKINLNMKKSFMSDACHYKLDSNLINNSRSLKQNIEEPSKIIENICDFKFNEEIILKKYIKSKFLSLNH